MKEAKSQIKLFFNRFGLVILAVFFAVVSASAQVKTVTGVVKDASGDVVIGASVIVKGTKTATITDIDGKFKVLVPTEGKTLLVSYIGMEPQEVAIKSSALNVILQAIDKSLDEVVVIGYGTQKKKDLTGSVSSVGEKDLKDIPVSTVAEALTGKLPGVQVTTTEGSPDAEIKIRVRGGGSITQSNSPLYIVDGFAKDDIKDVAPTEILTVDVLKDASSTAIYGSRGANGVIIVTTKSGASGKITLNYNGYVGFKEVSNILGVLTPYQYAKKQYERALLGNTVPADYEAIFGSYGDIDLYNYTNPTNWQKETFGRTGTTQNHNVSLTGGNKIVNFNVNYSRIDDKAIMIMSDYHRDNLSAKVNLQPLKWLKVDLSARYAATVVNGSGANDQTGTEKSTSDSRVKNAVVYTPIPLKNLTTQDDNIDAFASLVSPIRATQDNNRYQNTKDFNFNGGLTFNITKNLIFKTSFGMTNTNKIDKRFFGITSYYVQNGGAYKYPYPLPAGATAQLAPTVYLYDYQTTILQNTNTLSYKKENIFPQQDISVVLGQESYNKSTGYKFKDVEALKPSYNSTQAWDSVQNGYLFNNKQFLSPDNRMFSYFGRVNYSIKGKYLLAAIFRADGSSKFSNGNQWGYFPSFSAGWRISEEQFMKNLDWISNLKLRGSYGQSGNNNIDVSAFTRAYQTSANTYLPNSMQTPFYTAGDILANKDLKWETTTTRNAGLDFGFLKNRINGSLEVYSNTTSGVLILMPISGVGYTYQWQNVGQTSNKGVELNLNAIAVQTKDFNLSFGFNISSNVNNVDNLGTLPSYTFNENWASSMGTAMNSYIVKPGSPVGLIYGFVNDGMYSPDDFKWNGSKWIMNDTKFKPVTLPDNSIVYRDVDGNTFVDNSTVTGLSWGPGAMKLKDTNGDGKITDADRQVIGNSNPKHYGSFSINATYKGFDFSSNLNWVYGNSIYNATKIELSSMYYKGRNMLSSNDISYTQVDWATGNRVTDPTQLTTMNANANIWATPTGQYAITSWGVEDGSFLRLNNLTVGYTIPAKVTKKFFVQKLRVYASGYNLFILTKYSGYDPEVDTRRSTPATPGVDYSAYPKSHSYNIGVNITF